jgi:chromosome segregation ATPase
MVADVEQTTLDNGKLTQALEKRRAAMDKLAQEKDAAVRSHRQAQEELGPLRLELSVATKDLKKARVNCEAQQREIDRVDNQAQRQHEETAESAMGRIRVNGLRPVRTNG